MGKYLKKFETHTEYEAFTATTAFIKPNVSLCVQENEVHYNPWVEPPIVIAKYNVKSTSTPTNIGFNQFTSGFSAIEIDGVELPSVVSAYTFSTAGEHTVKYLLSSATTVALSSFRECTCMVSVTIPNSVTSIGTSAFNGCSGLTSVTIGNSVTSIESWAFYQCSGLTSVTIPDSVQSIAQTAFEYCTKLTSITIGNGVTSIGNSAFTFCTTLTSVTIGNSVTSIGMSAFYGCSKLESIISLATAAPTIKSSTFQNVKTNGTLTVPSGSSGYDVWMGTGNYYLGKYSWTKVEQ